MLLQWLADTKNYQPAADAANLIVRAVDRAFASGALNTVELGGQSTLNDVYQAVDKQLS